MKRRVAVKKIGEVFGYSIAAPTLLQLMYSCNDKDKQIDWHPKSMTKEQGMGLKTLLNVLIPQTDSLSATDVNVHMFVDELVATSLPVEGKLLFTKGIRIFFDEVLFRARKPSLFDIEENDFVPLLTDLFASNKSEQNDMQKISTDELLDSFRNDEISQIHKIAACTLFANEIRDLAILGFKSSERVAKELMAYLPVPGSYIPCEDLGKLTNNRAWALD